MDGWMERKNETDRQIKWWLFSTFYVKLVTHRLSSHILVTHKKWDAGSLEGRQKQMNLYCIITHGYTHTNWCTVLYYSD